MMKTIGKLSDLSTERELATLVLKLLFHSCKIKVNKRKMIQLSATNTLLSKLKLAFSNESYAGMGDTGYVNNDRSCGIFAVDD